MERKKRKWIKRGKDYRKSERMSWFCHNDTLLRFLKTEAKRLSLSYPTELLRLIIAEYATIVGTDEGNAYLIEYVEDRHMKALQQKALDQLQGKTINTNGNSGKQHG